MKNFARFIKDLFITEGGNIVIGSHKAHAIDVQKHGRTQLVSDVHSALSDIHNSFKQKHGTDLFGKDQKGLSFSGSSEHLFNKNISDKEFTKHKPQVGDIDVKIPKEHLDDLKAHLEDKKHFGKYTVVGTKKSGSQLHALMQHENGQTHQIDFEKTEFKNDKPEPFESFGHSSDWTDIKHGIKGMHHKVLLNAIGLDKHKFGNTKGLMSRIDDSAPPIRDLGQMGHALFGKKVDASKLSSFHGLTSLIKEHLPKEMHQKIADKFVNSVQQDKKIDSTHAINYLHKHLGTSGEIEHHTSVVPLTGFSPHSHMGHALDLGRKLASMPGTKHMGISNKTDVFTPEERYSILKKQWKMPQLKAHFSSSGGEVVSKAFHELPKNGKRHIHILVGHDRASLANNLKKALETGKIKEMNGEIPDSVTVHYPDDSHRGHGMSGTKMRVAAANDDFETYHKHIGPMFSKDKAAHYFGKIKAALDSGKLKVKR